MSGSLTLKQVQEHRVLMPVLAQRVDMELSSTYEEFVDCVHAVLDSIINYIEENPGIRKEDSEDRLTIEIVGALRQAGFDADHDTKIGGHVDIRIRHRIGFLWLGEAKIHSDYDWLMKGFNQLSTRYARGTPNHNHGGLIIYIRAKGVARIVNEWKACLVNAKLNGFSTEQCPKRSSLSFYSTHILDGANLPYHVRHMAVFLHYEPKDADSQQNKVTRAKPRKPRVKRQNSSTSA